MHCKTALAQAEVEYRLGCDTSFDVALLDGVSQIVVSPGLAPEGAPAGDLLREAKARGCQTMSGLWMNVTVAASQMKLWWGIDAPTDFMYQCAANFLRSQGRMQ